MQENPILINAATTLDGDTTPSSGCYIGMEKMVRSAAKSLLTAMFPCHFGKECNELSSLKKRSFYLDRAFNALSGAFAFVTTEEEAKTRANELIAALPEIYNYIKTDLIAAYEGDPAAKSVDEIILSYPSFKAVTAYRIAHEIYKMRIPFVPRMITEFAHEMTGIDIHPGATIGKYFFIDHGTGVVIGETTVIGDHVKLYQNVTLGAKSFEVNEDGSLVKGTKRHPTIGNHVVVYAGATILGGNTFVGDDCVVGGNVWLTKSIEKGTTVTLKNGKK